MAGHAACTADDGYVEAADTRSCDIHINVVYLTGYLPSLQF